MIFNQGSGFFTPKNFQLPQHFTPKTIIAQSTTTNESCSLILDSDVRSVTYALKSSKESTIHNDTNSTSGDQKNIKMIEYEEYEKSHSPSLKSSVDYKNHYIKEILIGGEGKLIAEGTLSNTDSEECNVITPSSKYFQQFDFKLIKHQVNEEESCNIGEIQDNNFIFNDKQNNLSQELQKVKNDSMKSLTNKDKQNIDLEKNRRCNYIQFDSLEKNGEYFQEYYLENKQFIPQEEVKNLNERNKRIEKNIEQNNQGNPQIQQKSKILVQDQICSENVIYEEEDSENSKSTDRQYNIQNQISSYQHTEQQSQLNNNLSSEKYDNLSKTKSNQNNSSKKNSNQSSQDVKAFSIEEYIQNEQIIPTTKYEEDLNIQNKIQFSIQSQNQQIYLQNQYKQDKKLQKQFKLNQNLQIQEKEDESQLIQQKQNQNQSCLKNNINIKETRNNFFQNNKSSLNINNINYQDEYFNNKSYQNQNQHLDLHDFFIVSKNNKQEQKSSNNKQKIMHNSVNNQQNQFQENTTLNNQSQKNHIKHIEAENKQFDSDKLFYPSSIHENDLKSLKDYNKLQNNQRNKNVDPSQKLNFDQCESSEKSSSMKGEEDNDSIILKQNFQNLISNYKQRNQSFPQLNSNNTSRNSNFNNSNIKESNIQDSYNNQNKILSSKQTEKEIFDDSNQKYLKNDQFSAILKKLEETLDMNSESEFYLIKKLQISHNTSQQLSENDKSNNQQQNNQLKNINSTINQTYILEETGEDFILNSKDVEKLEQIDNNFFLNHKESIDGHYSSLNLDGKCLFADTVYSNYNNSHLYFINNLSTDKKTQKSQKKEVKLNKIFQFDLTQPHLQLLNLDQKNKNHMFCSNNSSQQFIENNYMFNLQQSSYNNFPSEQSKSQYSLRQKLSSTVSNLNSQQQQNQELKLNADFIQENDYLKKEVIKLNKDLKNIDIQNSKYQEIIDQQQANILRLEEKLIHYKDELKTKLQYLENKDMQISKLFEEKEQLKTKKNKLKEILKEKESYNLQQKKNINSSESGDIQRLQKDLEENQGLVNKFDIQLNEIQKKYAEKTLQLKARTQEISHLKKEIKNLNNEIVFNRKSENIFTQQGAQSIDQGYQFSNQQNNYTDNSDIIRLSNNNFISQNSGIILNQESYQQNNISVSSSISQVSSSSNKNKKKQNIVQNFNEQRERSYSYNDSSLQNNYVKTNRVPVINQNSLTISQPYNLTEESQNIRMLTQIDQQENHEDFNNHQRMKSSSSYSNQIQNKNQTKNKNVLSEKSMHQQMRYSYDNYKTYQNDNQQSSNTNINNQQPMTLNFAIAQHKIQALDERKKSDYSASNNILVSQQYNPQDSFQVPQKKQFENTSHSSIYGSESQFVNKSHISTSCNSRHMESSNTQYTNSQICSHNTSQKSLNQQQNRQQNKIQCNAKQQSDNQKPISNQQLQFKSQIDTKNKIRNIASECSNNNTQSNNFSQMNSQSDQLKNERSQNLNQQNYLKEFNYQMIIPENNKSQTSYNNEYKGSTSIQDKQIQFNVHQNSVHLTNSSCERTKTSPNNQQARNKIVETSEYSSVPQCSYQNQSNDGLNQTEQFNRINGSNQRKLSSNGFDLASINQKINSNYQLIQCLSLHNKNKQDQLQKQNLNSLQNNFFDNSQNKQHRLKREHSYTFNESTNSKLNTIRNSNVQQIQPQNQYNMTHTVSIINDINCKQVSMKPPRSSNEIRLSSQFNNIQQLNKQQLQDHYEQNNNENQLNASNVDIKSIQYQKQFNYPLNYDKKTINQYQYQNPHPQQIHSNQQYVPQSSLSFDKLQKI